VLDCKLECVSGTVTDSYRIGGNLIIIRLLHQQNFIPLAAPLTAVQERLYRQQ